MLIEKYRPKTLDEIIGIPEIVNAIKGFINSKDGIPHLMFYGNPGTGKTTLAKIIGATALKNLGDFYEFNASNDRGIEFIRTTISEIARRKSLSSEYKIIFMDEADNITDDAQAAFRRILEQYSDNCRFIFACNYPHKIIDAVKSRFVKYEFKKPSVDTIQTFLRTIAKLEGMEVTEEKLKRYAETSKGDFRNSLTILEGKTETGGVSEEWKGMTIAQLRKMTPDARANLCFQGDAEIIFNHIWDAVQKEAAWSLVPLLCDCQHKMNLTLHKTLFLVNMVRQFA